MEDIRQRMIGDMKLRGLTPSTQATYLEAVSIQGHTQMPYTRHGRPCI